MLGGVMAVNGSAQNGRMRRVQPRRGEGQRRGNGTTIAGTGNIRQRRGRRQRNRQRRGGR